MGSDQEATRQAIRHWRKLREWVTDLRARRALRELILRGEAELTAEKHTNGKDAEEKNREPLARERES